MTLFLEVGELARRTIKFAFNRLPGELKIQVNKIEIKRDVRLNDEPETETHTLQLGEVAELTTVRVENQRKLLCGEKCRVYVSEWLHE